MFFLLVVAQLAHMQPLRWPGRESKLWSSKATSSLGERDQMDAVPIVKQSEF